ncbi:MAG: magnesium transporter [Calditrichaeota bacterium]|nr:MAG: magnesium transporter [Calditrichota bacterium]
MKSDQAILHTFITQHPADAALILERLKIEEIVLFLKEIPNEQAVAIFNYLERNSAVKCLEMLSAEQSAAIIENLPMQIASVFLRQVRSELREAILIGIPQEISIPIKRMLSFPPDSAGALADPFVLTLPDNSTVKEALRTLKKYPEKSIFYLYIINRQQKLVGVLNMRELMLARSNELVSIVMNKNLVQLNAELGFQAILSHKAWNEYHALPVVDSDGILLGMIRYKSLNQIKNEGEKNRQPHHSLAASLALGELYKIGFSGLIRSAAEPLKRRSEEKNN